MFAIRRSAVLLLLSGSVLALGCADDGAPQVIPVDGEYELFAAAAGENPLEAEWSFIPVEYDVAGDSTCVFALLGGTITIADRTYTADLQQEVVSCELELEPLTHETGRLARVYGNRSRAFNGRFAFLADLRDSTSVGWLQLAQPIEDEFLVKLVPPMDSGVVHWLRFQRK